MTRSQFFTEDSYIKNCFIKARKGDDAFALMQETDKGVVIRLDGYALVPREEYDELVSKIEAEGLRAAS